MKKLPFALAMISAFSYLRGSFSAPTVDSNKKYAAMGTRIVPPTSEENVQKCYEGLLNIFEEAKQSVLSLVPKSLKSRSGSKGDAVSNSRAFTDDDQLNDAGRCFEGLMNIMEESKQAVKSMEDNSRPDDTLRSGSVKGKKEAGWCLEEMKDVLKDAKEVVNNMMSHFTQYFLSQNTPERKRRTGALDKHQGGQCFKGMMHIMENSKNALLGASPESLNKPEDLKPSMLRAENDTAIATPTLAPLAQLNPELLRDG